MLFVIYVNWSNSLSLIFPNSELYDLKLLQNNFLNHAFNFFIMFYLYFCEGYSSYNYMGLTGGNLVNNTWVMGSEQ